MERGLCRAPVFLVAGRPGAGVGGEVCCHRGRWHCAYACLCRVVVQQETTLVYTRPRPSVLIWGDDSRCGFPVGKSRVWKACGRDHMVGYLVSPPFEAGGKGGQPMPS